MAWRIFLSCLLVFGLCLDQNSLERETVPALESASVSALVVCLAAGDAAASQTRALGERLGEIAAKARPVLLRAGQRLNAFFKRQNALLARVTPRKPTPAINKLVASISRKHGLDPHLVHAIIRVESAYDPKAVSRAGAQGLMQLMPATQDYLRVKNPFDPAQNISGGVRFMKMMLRRFGDTELALAAYNAGPTAVKKYAGIPPYKETRRYVKKVLGVWKRNKRLAAKLKRTS